MPGGCVHSDIRVEVGHFFRSPGHVCLRRSERLNPKVIQVSPKEYRKFIGSAVGIMDAIARHDGAEPLVEAASMQKIDLLAARADRDFVHFIWELINKIPA